MKKKIISTIVASVMALSLIGCGGESKATSNLAKDTNPDKGLSVLGENVKFDPNKLVNDGEPITVEFWLWDSPETFEKIVKQYEEIYPNVDIKIVAHPWDDYWTKLPLALNGKNGPGIFAVHNSQHDNLINYMAPYDISLDELSQDFMSVEPHVIDGKVYYIDYGMMTGTIYYNKELWKNAGLTENDIPKTWDEFIKVAEKLTIVDDSGNFTQAGFNYNGDYAGMIMGLNYQYGELLFEDDDKTVNLDNPTMVKTTQFLVDLYEKYKVGSKDFGVDAAESFGQGQSAMVYKWGHYNNNLINNYPDIEYGVFQIPTPTTETPFAFDRYNGESTMSVNKNASEGEQEVAQDFIKYFLANDEIIKELCLNYSVFPTKYSLKDDSNILEHPILSVLAPNIERYIWPGPFPSTIENTLKTASQDVLYNGVKIEDAMKKAQDQVINDMKNSDFKSVEKQYKYYSDKK